MVNRRPCIVLLRKDELFRTILWCRLLWAKANGASGQPSRTIGRTVQGRLYACRVRRCCGSSTPDPEGLRVINILQFGGNIGRSALLVSSQAEPMPRQLAGFIARFTSAANLWPNTVDGARRRNADLAQQGGATIAVALHAPKSMVGKRAGDAIEIAIVLGREPGPVAGKRAASPAAPTERSCIR